METKEQIKAALKVVLAVADAIRDECADGPLGFCPAGPVYAALQTRGVSLEDYQGIIRTLVNAGLVEDHGDRLVWIGPPKEEGTPA